MLVIHLKGGGLLTVIDSLKIIEKTIPNIKLLIIGKSSFDQVIKDKVKQNQIEKLVDFIGWIKRVIYLIIYP